MRWSAKIDIFEQPARLSCGSSTDSKNERLSAYVKKSASFQEREAIMSETERSLTTMLTTWGYALSHYVNLSLSEPGATYVAHSPDNNSACSSTVCVAFSCLSGG